MGASKAARPYSRRYSEMRTTSSLLWIRTLGWCDGRKSRCPSLSDMVEGRKAEQTAATADGNAIAYKPKSSCKSCTYVCRSLSPSVQQSAAKYLNKKPRFTKLK